MEESNAAVARRTVLRGVAIAGAAVAVAPVLAACGADQQAATGATPAPDTSTPPFGAKSGGDSGTNADVLVATKDVPKGGGIILDGDEVVVTQPTAGEFKAFSSICTHQGCPVNEVADGTINCPCHGSRFSVDDGSVVAGPAPSPLPPVQITVEGKQVVRA